MDFGSWDPLEPISWCWHSLTSQGFSVQAKTKWSLLGATSKKSTSLIMVILLYVIAYFFRLEKIRYFCLYLFYLKLHFDPLNRLKNLQIFKVLPQVLIFYYIKFHNSQGLISLNIDKMRIFSALLWSYRWKNNKKWLLQFFSISKWLICIIKQKIEKQIKQQQ